MTVREDMEAGDSGLAAWARAISAEHNDDHDTIATGRLSETGLSATYAIRRVWDGSAYPARVEGATNIFVGPVDPGIAMDPEADVWTNPDVATLAQVIDAAENTESLLAAAIRAASTALARPVLNAITLRPTTEGTPPTLTAQSSQSVVPVATVPVLQFAAGVVGSASGSVMCPDGWNTARLVLLWTHNVSTPTGNVRWFANANRILEGGFLSDNVVTTAEMNSPCPDASGKVARVTFAASIPVTPGSPVRVTVARRGNNAGDTFSDGSTAQAARLIEVQLERLS